MQSVVSYPDRGPWGRWDYRGNMSGYLVVDLIRQFKPRLVVDPFNGGGTTGGVCRDMGVPCWVGDLKDGFDVLEDDIPVGADLALFHLPYWDMIPYSGHVWGDKPHPHDLSHARTYEEFLRMANEAEFRVYDSLRRGGRLAILVGAIRRKGVLYPIHRDMRLYGELEHDMVKVQHNCLSNRRTYANEGKLVRLVHEWLLILRKPDAWIVPIRIPQVKHLDLRKSRVQTWVTVVRNALEFLGGRATLRDIYGVVENHAKVKAARKAGHDWRAQVRRALQKARDIVNVSRGVWAFAEPALAMAA